jgi:putative transposase
MPNYRRWRIPGGCYFFTVTLLHRHGPILLTDNIETLRAAVRGVQARHPFSIDAWVVLPDHLHAIWTLPRQDDDFSTRWRLIKAAFSHGLPATECRSRSRLARAERGIWQQRFWEHAIRNDADYAAHMDYVHANPVKHGLVAHPSAWRRSTFRAAVARGIYPASWVGTGSAELLCGEP